LKPEAIKRLQEITNLDKVEVVKLYEIFLSVSEGGTRMLNIEMFRKSLGKLEACGLQNLDDSPFVERLFILLDTNGDGVVDLHEFVTGLSLLCKGTIEQKLELSFKAYDLDGNGYISKDELASMFKSAWISAFQALCATYGNEELSKEDLNEFSEEMATQFSNNSFNTLDLNGDGQISFEEFKEFAMSEPKITATLNEFKKEVNITF
jgi:Ca2+-binding EF-hand superfamily protein